MVRRRPLLATTAGMMLTGALPRAQAALAKSSLRLWPDVPPGGGGPVGPLRVTAKGAVNRVAVPFMQVYRPESSNGAAVLIAGGGGLKHIELQRESIPAALWLAARGITAFVLVYRLPGEGWQDGPKAPFQDSQRAVRLIRAKAKLYGLDPGRVGVLGFSAGGYLMGLAADWFDFHSYPPVDSVDFLSARPDNAALIYPVITLQPPYQNTSTRRQVVGEAPTPQMSAEWSVQSHVRHNCPPVFMVQAKDDSVSNPANTLIMEKACSRAGVPVVLHQLISGGHGFGMGIPGTPTVEWPIWYANWLTEQGMIKI